MRKALLVLLLLHAPAYAQSLQQQVNDVREATYETRTEIRVINEYVKRNDDEIKQIKESLKRLESKADEVSGAWKLVTGLVVLIGVVTGGIQLWSKFKKGTA